MPTIKPYGSWVSPLKAADVASAQIRLGLPCLDRGMAYWLERRPDEGGRSTLVRRDGGGIHELTPAPFNVRTLVHEYGGGDYAVRDGIVVAASYADQRVYRLDAARALTPETGGRLRYADFAIDASRGLLFAVREEHGGEVESTLVRLSLDRPDAGTVLVRGHDFVSSPRLSPDGSRLAWLTWEHPNMPWDGTRLWVAAVRDDGSIDDPRCVAGGADESIVQPEWSPSGVLHFASDRTGFWNLYRLEGDVRALCPMDAEFAGPAWAFGQSWYAFLGPDDLLCACTEDGFWRLGRLDARSGSLRTYDLPYVHISSLRAEGRRAILRVAGPDRPAAIALFDPDSGAIEPLREAGALPVDPAWLSRPEPVHFVPEPGIVGHAFHYPPTNPDFEAPEHEHPPLIVHSHGGPTGAASAALDLETQFWTSRGFAVVDVNYRGSTGFGRAYRKALEGRWGEVDVHDCVSAVRHLIGEGQADSARLAISGGSAGGFTTLCALTFTRIFKVGASHYGIGDLEALARDTHKFESRYLDRLVGPWPEARELYVARSPIHHTERLSCPVIFFQGLEDTIVPPNQAETMVEALRRKRLPVAYLTFEGEQHGFRRASTITRVLEAQLYFFCRMLGIAPGEDLPEIPIEHF